MNDVAIVGGGAVGACLACLLRADGIAVTLIERDLPEPPAPSAPPDARVVALSRASERVLRAAGAWPALAGPRLEPYERMRIWHERQDPAVALTFEAAEVGEPNLGYIAENRLLQAALLGAFRAAGGTLMRAAFTTLTLTPERALIGTDAGEVTARLAVGADGAQSPLRAAARLSAAPHDYGQSAIVANVASAQPHAHTAWQRFLHDGTLAFLPLFDGTSSIVWSADEPRARALMALGEPAFAAALTEASAGVLGELRLTTPRRALPLQGRAAERYVAERVALIGDAAHVVHPLAGQGVNLGLLDAAALAQEVRRALGSREDPGALAVLRAYERWRKSEVALMASAIDAFDRLLAHGSGPAARIAQAGLTVVNRSAELKRLFIRRALGTSGELPRAAR
ncbi:MAG TPA: FAD-dependent monooxygenase [Steroidobacteraceae bacterium]|nr:FAD-dependent monooxygenase [Steroidobacteraceae bacterium]